MIEPVDESDGERRDELDARDALGPEGELDEELDLNDCLNWEFVP